MYLIGHGVTKGRWYASDVAAVLRDRLTAHCVDERILWPYRSSRLYMTWTVLRAAGRDGLEVYLADRDAPLVGDRGDLPWDRLGRAAVPGDQGDRLQHEKACADETDLDTRRACQPRQAVPGRLFRWQA
jgi:hypothetical protein